jgi:hypothetical protein
MNNNSYEGNVITAYKYVNEINHMDRFIFNKLFENWYYVLDREINELIAIVEKYSYNDSFILDCYRSIDTITLFGDNIHYYIYFKKNEPIELWCIEGKYDNFTIDLYFDEILEELRNL